MLGEMYYPKGYALETAQEVLDCKDVRAINVAWGCTHGCNYPCFVSKCMRCSVEEAKKVHLPKENPAKLIANQLNKEGAPAGVFLSFLTDPLLAQNIINTVDVIQELHLKSPSTRVAVLTKTSNMHFLPDYKIRFGATIVSESNRFQKQFEPLAAPIDKRIDQLVQLKKEGSYVWVSMEPYPCSAIHKQDLKSLLGRLAFADFIIFGKWNYNVVASTPAARAEYKNSVDVFRGFCKSHGIRFHVKSETLKFIGEAPNAHFE